MKRVERSLLQSHLVIGLCALSCFTAGAANINGGGVSLNLVTSELSSSATQTNSAGKRVVFAGTPVAGIVSANGAGAKVVIEPMMVITGNGMPVADFTAAPHVGGAPLEVHFFDQSLGGLYEILSWTWDFGDGSPYSSDRDPIHTYDSPGAYTVSLIIMTTGGPAYIVRANYITVVQAVPATSWSTLLMLAMVFIVTGGVVVRKHCRGCQFPKHW